MHIVKTSFPSTHSLSRIWEKSLQLKCLLTTLFAILRSSKKKLKNSRLNFFEFYSNPAHNLVKHLVACLGRHGTSADFLTLSRNRAILGAIFTTTTRNLCACDVIMKMVYFPGLCNRWLQQTWSLKRLSIPLRFISLSANASSISHTS